MELTHTVVEGWDGEKKRNCKAFQDFRKTVTKTCALFSVARSHKPTGRAHGGARGGSWSLVGNFGGHDGAGTVFTQKLDFNQN